MRSLALWLVVVPALASAQPRRTNDVDDLRDCDATVDPIGTPLRDPLRDVQRGACVRRELDFQLAPHALIDTPGFHGVLGADLVVTGRYAISDAVELTAGVRVLGWEFVQNAVNKVTNTSVGPLVIGGMYSAPFAPRARIALIALAEVPYTRDDTATLRTGGQLTAALTARLARRWFLHARLGAVFGAAVSSGGDTERVALRAGADGAWIASRRFSVQAGAEMSSGWVRGLDHILLRAGTTFRLGTAWHMRTGLGVPLAGTERTTAVLDLTLIRDL